MPTSCHSVRGAHTASNTSNRLSQLVVWVLGLGLLSSLFADIVLYSVDPLTELGRIGLGLVQPSWPEPKAFFESLGLTIAFALLAIAIAMPAGLLLATLYDWPLIRMLCASLRSIHELFWGLLFMQVFGLTALTGLLALVVPYTAIFAKVYSETLALQTSEPERSIPNVNPVTRWCYSRIPQAWPALVQYSRYRFECALRSSAILGFIGLPTLGFHLESAFKEGYYSEAAGLLFAFFAMVGSIRLWLKPKLIPVYLLLAIWMLPETEAPFNATYFWQFISQDIWPRPLLEGNWAATFNWYHNQFSQQAWPGVQETLLVTQAALGLTLVLTLMTYPLANQSLVGKPISRLGHLLLVLMRSTPEMVLAFIFLLLFGPSALPAILALAIHNSGLIAYLVATNQTQTSATNTERQQWKGHNFHPAPAAPLPQQTAFIKHPLLRYAYIETPTQMPNLMVWLFYRWEVILRESAILGILGVATLGFYIDSAFEEIRYDKAFFLILITIALNLIVETLARTLRKYAEAK